MSLTTDAVQSIKSANLQERQKRKHERSVLHNKQKRNQY